MTAPIAILGVADLLMYLELAGFATPTGLGWRLGLAAIIVLISVIGGRIIPSFTRNWLAKRGAVRLPAIHGWIDSTSLGLLHAGLIGWVFCPGFRPFGALLLLAAGFNLARLARWRGGATSAEPLLVILHLGYLWLIVGTALLGATMLDEAIPEAAAIHALTVGTIGTMVLAVMTRVSLGHAGRALTADYVTISIYVLVNAAALTRIAAALSGSPVSLLIFSAALWVGSFTLFAIRYGPVLTSHRIRSTLVA
jgi:uncharacterized protein involved in response to NO